MLLAPTLSVDPHKPNTCVLQSEFSTYDKQRLLWVSRNTYNLLRVEQNEVLHRSILAFVPRIVALPHPTIVKVFFERGNSVFINQLQDAYNIDANNALFGSKVHIKMCFDSDHLSLVTYIERQREATVALLDEHGNLDSLSSRFATLLGVSTELSREHTSISIFVLFPQLIPFLLPHFYNLPNFALSVNLLEI